MSQQPGRNSGTFIALFGLLVIAAGLLGLSALILPIARGIIVLVLLFLGMIAFHYCVWGWWLSTHAPTDERERPWE